MKFITNPIKHALLKYNLIDNKNLLLISKRTRDKKIRVFQDKKSKIIFLEKQSTQNDYAKIKYNDFEVKNFYKTKIINNKKLKVKMLRGDDIKRRLNDYYNLYKNKNILDFGSGWGGFLLNIKKKKSLTAFELRSECLTYLKKKKIICTNNLDNLKNNYYEFVSLFHVYEHIPNQIEILNKIYSKMKKNGKLVIEVPHANEFLLKANIEEYKNFIFWSQHLILHTKKSLKMFLEKSKFKKIKIQYVQRYNIQNHLKWIIERKPSGHEGYLEVSHKLNLEYKNFLIKNKLTDTIVAIATK